MRFVTSLLSAVLLTFALASVTPACTHTPPDLTPQAQAAFKANQVATRIGELQDAAIAFNKATPQVLNDHDAVTVVSFTVMALQTMRSVPDGWQATVLAAYGQFKQALAPAAKQKLSAVLLTVDTSLAALGLTVPQ